MSFWAWWIALPLFLTSCRGNTLNVNRADNDLHPAIWSAPVLSDSYVLGETFQIPSRTLTLNGVTVDASAYAILPSGEATSSSSFTLVDSGKYTLHYDALFEGRHYSEDESFFVYDRMMKVSSKRSALSYGEYTDFGADSTGASLSLAEGDSLLFTGQFDLSKATFNETLIQGFIAPRSQGSVDFSRLTFRFTDVTDSSSFFDIRIQFYDHPSAQGISYAVGSFDGVNYVGEETAGKIHKNDENKGTIIPSSFNATENEGGRWAGANHECAPDKNPFSLSYDAASKQVFANGKFVCDFDDKTYFSTIWGGLPSGKAKLSVFASSYLSATANFVLREVKGIDLASNKFVDNEAPSIQLSIPADSLPTARYGKGERYPIPEATAYDAVCGSVQVKATPYGRYTTNQPIVLSVKDGRFPTEEAGVYAIVYTAKDYLGNEAKAVLPISSSKDIAPLSASVSMALSVVNLGQFVEIPIPTTAGGSGSISYEVTAIHQGERIPVWTSFRPEKAGEWTLDYKIRDFLGDEAECSCSFEAVVSATPILVNAPELPSSYVSGSFYQAPSLSVLDYASGSRKEILCQTFVTDKNGRHALSNGSTFVPEVEKEGDNVSFTFEASGFVSDTYEVPCVLPKEDGYVNLANYFLGSGFDRENLYQVNSEHTGALLTATEAGDIGLLFGNPLGEGDMILQLANVPSSPAFSGIEITFTDEKNPEEVIGLRLTSENANAFHLQLINGLSYTISGKSFLSGTCSTISVSYEAGMITVDSVSLSVNKTIHNADFQGFSSGKAVLRIKMLGAALGSRLLVEKVGSNFFSTSLDLGKPLLQVNGDSGGSIAMGSVYATPTAVGYDTLCPNVSVTISAYWEDGTTAKAQDGQDFVALDASKSHALLLDRAGVLTLTYRAQEDASWGRQRAEESFVLTVMDQEKPTISLASTLPARVRVGTSVTYPKLQVKDNISTEENIQLIRSVSYPDGTVLQVEENYVVNCLEKGTYRFLAMAIDEAGNASIVIFNVEAIQ